MQQHSDTMRWMRRLLPLLLLILPAIGSAQVPDLFQSGRTFVLAFPDTTRNTTDPRRPNTMPERLMIYIYSAVDTRVTISGNGYQRTVTPAAGAFERVDLTDAALRAPNPIVTQHGVASDNTFRLEADDPIIVYCYMLTRFGAEAWTPLPVEAWGNDYYAAALPGETVEDVIVWPGEKVVGVRRMAPAEIMVIASEDNTIVNFTPNGRVLNNSQLVAVKLNRNQAYQIQSWVDTSASNSRDGQPDIAGTFIQASRPIGVISGNTRTMTIGRRGLTGNAFRNMAIEWLAPVEQHSTSFVYTPTWDTLRPSGQPGEDLTRKRASEYVRVYATTPTGTKTLGYHYNLVAGNPDYFTLDVPRLFFETQEPVAAGDLFRTDLPTQVFKNAPAVVVEKGSNSFEGWGGYMVELTPRSQWVNFVPFATPVEPEGMQHFVNIVTDTAWAGTIVWGSNPSQPAAVPFNRTVMASGYVWTTLELEPGKDYYIGSTDSAARFSGYVYGLRKGYESVDSSGYREELAVSYGYPLAPKRVTPLLGDSLAIDTSSCCCKLTVTVQVVNDDAVGLRSVTLDSIDNMKIVFNDPGPIVSKTKVQFDVIPIDPLKNASAVVVIRDRANKTWRIPYSYSADLPEIMPSPASGLDLGEVPVGTTSMIDEFTVTNPFDHDILISGLRWGRGDQGFEVVSTPLPIVLKKGESVKIPVRITPAVIAQSYIDTLKLTLHCGELGLLVRAEGAQPSSVGTGDEGSGGMTVVAEPNPTRGRTTFRFRLERAAHTTLELYDALGRRLLVAVDEMLPAGEQRIDIDAANLPAGVYYYRLRAGTAGAAGVVMVE